MKDCPRDSRCSDGSRELINNRSLQKDRQMPEVGTYRCRWIALSGEARRPSSGWRRTLTQASATTRASLVIKIRPATMLWSKRWARHSHHSETSNARKLWRSCNNSWTRPNSNLIQRLLPTKLSNALKHSQERSSLRRTRCGRCAIKTCSGPSLTPSLYSMKNF